MKSEVSRMFCRDYATRITFKLLAIPLLWLWYGLTPYTIPLKSLWLVTLIMLTTAFFKFWKGMVVNGLLILLAALLNALLILYLSKAFNLFLSLVITILLFWDVILTKQEWKK